MNERREYLHVRPSSQQLPVHDIVPALASLHKLTVESQQRGLTRFLPGTSSHPPRFEFLAVSEGTDEPVEFYYGADGDLDALEDRLRSIYPTTFDIDRTELNLPTKLIAPAEYSREEFETRLTNGQLHYEPTEGDRVPADSSGVLEDGGMQTESHADSVATTPPNTTEPTEATIPYRDGAFRLDSTQTVSNPMALSRPTLTSDGRILARPALEEVVPMGVRWHGVAERKNDWMTTMTPLTEHVDTTVVGGDTETRVPLAAVIDHLVEADSPIAFQVIFQRKPDWSPEAWQREHDIKHGLDTIYGKARDFIDPVTPDEHSLSGQDKARLERVQAKNPKRTFTVNVRAVACPQTETEQSQLDSRLDALATALDTLDGRFYGFEGHRLQASGFRQKTSEQYARAALERLFDRELVTGRGNTRFDLVLNAEELANLVTVPSGETISREGARGTRTKQQSRNPLPLPNPDLIQQFQAGMSVGYALEENGEPQPEPIQIPPNLLTRHYGRFASTGGGKSKAIINDALSLRKTTSGPVVIVDPKGDGMCSNYLRCHYKQFGHLDDVYQFRIPETVPAFSFFDIRPALEAGRSREDAIQDKVDHFHDILRMIMGREKYGQAFVANEILSYLLKALFDEEYGSDVFGLDDLFAAVLQMQQERTVPPVSAENQNVEESLTRHFAKDDHRFQVSMDAVGNRLDKLREDAHLRRIFSHVPEQNDNGEYVDNHFDFREFLDEDATILFDLGNLRLEAQRAITLLLLSNLWDAVQVRRRDGKSDYENLTNLIIEEAAPVASTKLVSEQLLPKGRSFGLGMGLVMQFPGQVRSRSERAYNEVLNNIKTKLIGDISIESDLAESLAHEDLSPTDLRNRINTLPSGEWIAQLPSPSFGETGPAPFSVKPLPIAPGHPESNEPLAAEDETHFEAVAHPRLMKRTQTQYGLTDSTTSAPEDEEWGSRPTDETTETTTSDSSLDSTQSSFIGQATSDAESDSEDETVATDIDSLPGHSKPAETEDSQVEEEATENNENESSPVQAGGVTVSDEEIRRRGLSRDDVRFLTRVLNVMNGDSPSHTLLDRMSSFTDDFDDLDVQRLVDQELLEEGRSCGRKTYTVLPAGRELLGQKLKVGPGQGDVGEKTPHKVGVKLLELWLEGRDNVAQVECYYEYDETVFDVAAFDADEELVWVGEAELPSNNKHAPVDDYEKQSSVDANAVWAFNRRETAIEVLDCLSEADRIESGVSGRAARSFSDIREAVESFDAAGLTTVRSFNKLDQEFNS